MENAFRVRAGNSCDNVAGHKLEAASSTTHAVGGPYHSLPYFNVSLSRCIFFFYLLIFLFTPVSIFYFSMVPVPFAVLFIKFIVDYWIIAKFSKLTNVVSLMKYFFVSELIHFPMILAAVFGSFWGGFEWKGRRMKREISQHA